jgi:hypothetical protein
VEIGSVVGPGWTSWLGAASQSTQEEESEILSTASLVGAGKSVEGAMFFANENLKKTHLLVGRKKRAPLEDDFPLDADFFELEASARTLGGIL